jgi:hypothetical protein
MCSASLNRSSANASVPRASITSRRVTSDFESAYCAEEVRPRRVVHLSKLDALLSRRSLGDTDQALQLVECAITYRALIHHDSAAPTVPRRQRFDLVQCGGSARDVPGRWLRRRALIVGLPKPFFKNNVRNDARPDEPLIAVAHFYLSLCHGTASLAVVCRGGGTG